MFGLPPDAWEHGGIGAIAFVTLTALVILGRTMLASGLRQMEQASERQKDQDKRYDALHIQFTEYLTGQSAAQLETQQEILKALQEHTSEAHELHLQQLEILKELKDGAASKRS